MRQFIPRPQTFRALYTPSIPQSTAIPRGGAPTRLFSQLSYSNKKSYHGAFRSQSSCLYSKRTIRTPVTYLTTTTVRHKSDTSSQGNNPLTDRASDATTDAQNEEQNRLRREQEPAYQITFTCKPCGQRSSHRMSKHGYHRGTVLIRCPSCESRHVISDHLNIFFDKRSTLEDILQEQGDKVTRGYLDGDMEFWDDGSVGKKPGQDGKSG